ncbi:MAG: hypothetical protein QW390_02825 [Candidatus Bathyarchaeia archaeon]
MEKPVEPVAAELSRGRVCIRLSSGVRDLRERGFGEARGGRLVLTPQEALYLAEKGRIKVVDRGGGAVGLQELARLLSSAGTESWIRYLVYRDLRERGYIVRGSARFDFEVQGKGALRRLVTIVHEGRNASLDRLERLLAAARREKKELVLAVIDRRTDIVYYTLDTLTIRHPARRSDA